MNQQRFERGEEGEGSDDDLTIPDDDLATPDFDPDDLTVDPITGKKVVPPAEDDLTDVSDLVTPEPTEPVNATEKPVPPLSIDDILGK